MSLLHVHRVVYATLVMSHNSIFDAMISPYLKTRPSCMTTLSFLNLISLKTSKVVKIIEDVFNIEMMYKFIDVYDGYP